MWIRIRLFPRIAILLLAAVALVLVSMAGSPVHAANITVNTTTDELNADGDCSLREAIEAANTDAAVDACAAGSGADTVTVPAGTYTISLAGADNTNAAGDFDILDDVTISGAGAGTTIVDGGGLDRSFDVINASDTVMISAVTIRNGDGGGISSNGILTISDSTISENNASSDGGAVSSGGPLTVTNSTLSGNTANTSGGIYVCAGAGDTTMITGTTISGNAVPGEGGAIWHECGSTMTIEDSMLSGNSSTNDDGGGIHNEEALVINNTTITGNTAAFDGGGIYSFGDVTITNSTLSANTGFGGGGMKNEGDVSMTNVTVSGNTATDSDGGGLGHSSDGGTASLTNVTIVDNTSAFTGDGIYNDFGTVTLKNTLVASNGDNNCGGQPVTSAGNNLEDANDCALAAAGDQPNTDPQIGSLADNGGPTRTHALLAGSPAIDTASADCPPPATDQRGVTRAVDGDENGTAVCDIGAYEFEPIATPTPTAAPTPTPAELPETGGSPSSSNGELLLAFILSAVGIALVGTVGVMTAVRRQR
jgi:CSLREA domain-containing protein